MKITAADLAILLEYAEKGRAAEIKKNGPLHTAPERYYVGVGRARSVLADLTIPITA